MHSVRDYMKLDLYLSADHNRTAVICWEIHIINDLKVNILIETDILISEQIDILLSQQKTIIESCQNVQLNLNVITLLNQINQLLLLNDWTTISVYSSIIVQIKPLNDLSTDEIYYLSWGVGLQTSIHTPQSLTIHSLVLKSAMISAKSWLYHIIHL